MKLVCLLIFLTVSAASHAVDSGMQRMSGSSAINALVAHGSITKASNASLLSAKTAFPSFDVLDTSASNTLIISAMSLSDIDVYRHYSPNEMASPFIQNSEFSYFTEFQLTLKRDLMITGQWTRLHTSYNDGYNSHRLLRPVEWSLATESRTSAAREVGLNWTVAEGLQVFTKLQTVNGSAWIPQVSVPRFVTQDSEHWTLAAVELVYTF